MAFRAKFLFCSIRASTGSRSPPLVLSRFRDGYHDIGVQTQFRPESYDRSTLAETLVAMGYYGVSQPTEYEEILSYLNRTRVEKRGASSDSFYLKEFELMLRCGLIPNLNFESISKYNKRFLLSMRATPLHAEPTGNDFESEIARVVEGLSDEFYEHVPIGPYRVMFCRLAEAGVTRKQPERPPDLHTMIRKLTCVDVLGSDSFRSDKSLTPKAKIRESILSRLGVRTVRVPFYDWNSLRDSKSQGLYLHALISSADRP